MDFAFRRRVSRSRAVVVVFASPGTGRGRRLLARLGDGPSLAYITDFLGTADGHALVRAFIKIKDTSLRRAVVRLVEACEILSLTRSRMRASRLPPLLPPMTTATR